MIEPNLELIAARLEGLEETIIARLIDRVQFASNLVIYEKGKSRFIGVEGLSLFEARLVAQETMDSEFGRFAVPEERPFNRNLQPPKRLVSIPENCLRVTDYDTVNFSADILAGYLRLVPRICEAGDDFQHGSSVEMDVYALHAISRRIHFGSFYVGEAKYSAHPEEYRKLVAAKDIEGMTRLLTRKEVEDRIIERVKGKVARLQADVNIAVRRLIDPELVAEFYREIVIPLTKRGEIAYICERDPSL